MIALVPVAYLGGLHLGPLWYEIFLRLLLLVNLSNLLVNLRESIYSVWRPGFVWTRWGSLQRSPDPL